MAYDITVDVSDYNFVNAEKTGIEINNDSGEVYILYKEEMPNPHPKINALYRY